MPAIAVVATRRAAARMRRSMGTREISSTVISSASGGQAAMVWLIGFGLACRIFAATDAATPSVSAARTAQRTRRSCGSGIGGTVVLLGLLVSVCGWLVGVCSSGTYWWSGAAGGE